ncbi:MAG: ribosomal-processing cysteine protease Prp [Lachnospiraceae bacterium]|nr:ribosomal-processing cysteine protease Prp [Lachnospiraceae bacterium]
MIEIKFKPQELELSVTGHAGAAEKGKDIVCSAVSILFCTLAQTLADSADALEEAPVIEMKDGNGFISCKPKESYLGAVQQSYMTILTGFELVAQEYKDYVNFTVEE